MQISDQNVHLVRSLLDEIFGSENFVRLITFAKTSGQTDNLLASVSDYLLWYAKNRKVVKYRQLYLDKEIGGQGASAYRRIQFADGVKRSTTSEELSLWNSSDGSRIYRLDNLTSQSPGTRYPVNFEGVSYYPKGYWKTEQSFMARLLYANRVESTGRENLYYVT